jgi:Na+-translocating ferredoxin:NAD+ oxidoreductase RnfG subunit
MARRRAGVTLLAAALVFPWSAAAAVYLTQDDAIKLAFAGAAVERRTVFLTPERQEEVRKLAGSDHVPDALVVAYVGTRDGRVVGTAYFDTHRVRTQNETIMVVVSLAGSVARVEVLAFAEPEEYLPRANWYAQFPGKALDDELRVRRGIRAVSGATLTARATLDAVRRILAVHRVLNPGGPASP